MAKFTYEPDREFLKTLGKLSDVKLYAPQMLTESAPILVEQLKSNLSGHVVTGSMVRSIKATGVKENEFGHYLVVRPTGKGTGKNATRNMEKFVHLELGTSKQPPRPVIQKTLNDSRARIEQKMQEVFEREISK